MCSPGRRRVGAKFHEELTIFEKEGVTPFIVNHLKIYMKMITRGDRKGIGKHINKARQELHI